MTPTYLHLVSLFSRTRTHASSKKAILPINFYFDGKGPSDRDLFLPGPELCAKFEYEAYYSTRSSFGAERSFEKQTYSEPRTSATKIRDRCDIMWHSGTARTFTKMAYESWQPFLCIRIFAVFLFMSNKLLCTQLHIVTPRGALFFRTKPCVSDSKTSKSFGQISVCYATNLGREYDLAPNTDQCCSLAGHVGLAFSH